MMWMVRGLVLIMLICFVGGVGSAEIHDNHNTYLQREGPDLFESVHDVPPYVLQAFDEVTAHYAKVVRFRIVRVNFKHLNSIQNVDQSKVLFLNLFDDLGVPVYIHGRHEFQDTVYLSGSMARQADRRFHISLHVYTSHRKHLQNPFSLSSILLRLSTSHQQVQQLRVIIEERIRALENIKIDAIWGTEYHYIAEIETEYLNFNTPLSHQIETNSKYLRAQFGVRIDPSLKDYQFVNESLGFAVGIHGLGQSSRIYKTTDGGLNWEKQEPKIGWNPYFIHFMNQRDGIITLHDTTGCPQHCQNKTKVLRTYDGGSVWREMEYPGMRGRLSKLVDGHDSRTLFSVLISPSPNNFKNGVQVSSETNRKIVRSQDSGHSWQVIYTDPDRMPGYERLTAHDRHLYFTSQRTTIIKLDYDGNEIETIEPHFGDISNLVIVSEDVFFVSTYQGNSYRLMRTIDGGLSWEAIFDGSSFKIVMVHSADEVALLVMRGQTPGPPDMWARLYVIAHTRDGGQTWQESEKLLSFLVIPDRRQTMGLKHHVLMNSRLLSLENSPSQ